MSTLTGCALRCNYRCQEILGCASGSAQICTLPYPTLPYPTLPYPTLPSTNPERPGVHARQAWRRGQEVGRLPGHLTTPRDTKAIRHDTV